MRRLHTFTLFFALTLGAMGSLHAQVNLAPVGQEASQGSTMTDGEIRRLDKDTGKVTIKHGPIRNLDMPPMTMVFVAKDKTQLANFKVGDKIQFTAINESGQYIVTDVRPLK